MVKQLAASVAGGPAPHAVITTLPSKLDKAIQLNHGLENWNSIWKVQEDATRVSQSQPDCHRVGNGILYTPRLMEGLRVVQEGEEAEQAEQTAKKEQLEVRKAKRKERAVIKNRA